MLLTQFLTGAPCQTIECDHDDPDETGQQNKENPALPVLHCASTNKKHLTPPTKKQIHI